MYKNLDEIKQLESFEYNCYHCGKKVIYKSTKRLINKFIKWNWPEEMILDFFNQPTYNLCSRCK